MVEASCFLSLRTPEELHFKGFPPFLIWINMKPLTSFIAPCHHEYFEKLSCCSQRLMEHRCLWIADCREKNIGRNESINHRSNLTGLASRGEANVPSEASQCSSGMPRLPFSIEALWFLHYVPDNCLAPQTWPNLFSGCGATNDRSAVA